MLDLLYIREAKRIREEYLDNLSYIIRNEDKIKYYMEKLKEIQQTISEDDKFDKKKYENVLFDLEKNMDNVKKYIQFYHDNIKKLDEKQKNLYYKIKDKYPDITDEEIKKEIVPFIKIMDKKYRDQNKDIFDIINEKKS